MIRILFVEDHKFFQQAFSKVLERTTDTIEVVARATTLAQGREYLGRLEEIDVAVIDLQLPDGNGMQLVRELREGGCELPVLVLTITEDCDVLDMVKELGADKVLTKRATLKEIVDAVRALGQDQ